MDRPPTSDGLPGRRWLPQPHRRHLGAPPLGALLGWRYAIWRVVDVQVADANEHHQLSSHRPRSRLPYLVVLRHERGPVLPDHDGGGLVHEWVPAGECREWPLVGERYAVRSCHRHPWPCVDHERDETASGGAALAERLLAGARAGVCASCLQPVGGRQLAVTFPEPSLAVPGAPGPTYHLRGRCWPDAARYDQARIVADTSARRLVTCGGTMFHHVATRRGECTAGPACTGRHGPPRTKPRHTRCVTAVYLPAPAGGPVCGSALAKGEQPGLAGAVQVRPLTNCGYQSPANNRVLRCHGEPTLAGRGRAP